jgi:hypothetical protein
MSSGWVGAALILPSGIGSIRDFCGRPATMDISTAAMVAIKNISMPLG